MTTNIALICTFCINPDENNFICPIILFKFQIEKMDYYSQEIDSITQDEQDNCTLKQFINKYRSLLQQCQTHQHESEQMKQKIHSLEQQNQRLLEEINVLKNKSHYRRSQEHSDKQKEFRGTGSPVRGYATLPPSTVFVPHQYHDSSLTKERTAYLQQTKRRVIDGFVSQLAQELDQSEESLKRERRMQQETRRSLALCNQQLSDLRLAFKGVDSQLAASIYENKILRQEIERERQEKQLLSRELQQRLHQFQRQQLGLNHSQLDLQLNRMDEVYQCIEMQLKANQI